MARNSKYSTGNLKKNKKQKSTSTKKQRMTINNDASSPKLVFTVHNSNVSGNCGYTVVANGLQLGIVSPLLLHVINRLVNVLFI